VSGDKVGVEVSEENMTDLESLPLGVVQVLLNVTLGIDDGRSLRLLVTD
jgi:hypothetical protein